MAELSPESDYATPNLQGCVGGLDLALPALRDVEGQFLRLATQGDDLVAVDSGVFRHGRQARYTGIEAEGNVGKNHFQGLVRKGRHLFLSGGDSTEPTSHVFVIEMATRPESGPFGSNVLFRSGPDPADGIVRVVALGAERWHAGGLGMLGDLLAVPLEGDDATPSRVVFLDVRDPLAPTRLPESVDIRRDNPKCSAAALARLPDGRVLCGVWWDAQGDAPHGRMDVYVSASDDLLQGFLPAFFTIAWPELYEHRDASYQSICFLQEEGAAPDASGALPLFVIGTENGAIAAPTQNGTNWADLYSARVRPWPAGGAPDAQAFTVELLKPVEFHCGRRQGNFDAAGGVHVDPAGVLNLYTGYHWRYDGNIHMAEFHGLPAPGSVLAGGAGWIELHERPGFDGRCLSVFGPAEANIPDYSRIYVQGGDFDPVVSSVRFQLRPGAVYRLFRAPGFQGTVAGVDYLDLVGTGDVVEVPDLTLDAFRFAYRIRSSRYL